MSVQGTQIKSNFFSTYSENGTSGFENTKPFRNDGLIECVQYIEKVGLENLPKGYIESFREQYGIGGKGQKVKDLRNKQIKGHKYDSVYRYYIKHGIEKTVIDLEIGERSVYRIIESFKKEGIA